MRSFIFIALIAFAAAANPSSFTASSQAYCPTGYYVGKAVSVVDHNSFIAGHAQAGVHNTCLKCPVGQTSNGGASPTCHAKSAAWSKCSHMGCKLTTVVSRCKQHQSANPSVALAAGKAIAQTGCTAKAAVKRIAIFHHGHEQAGTLHKCKLSGTSADADATRNCACLCMDSL